MKQTFKIAKTELQKLFYSPVAWMVLIIFTIQVGLSFTNIIADILHWSSINPSQEQLTFRIFANPYFPKGVFQELTTYLYLYIPLLTMNIISRELSTGSIKLLYSSPVTNWQIIIGKYLALLIFGLCMVAILMVFGLYAIYAVVNCNAAVIFGAILGIYLLICAYAAIGLFMSSLTSYSVVAAMGTLGILAVLGYVKFVGQDIGFIRDITYWMAISGRVQTFISGLLASEDIIYFIIVVVMFLSFTTIKLQSGRQKTNWKIAAGKYAGVFVVCTFIGYLSSIPKLKWYDDVTDTQMNTLSKVSKDVVRKLDGELKIKTYVNMLDQNFETGIPKNQKMDMKRFESYIRFKPDIKLEYEYYYHKADNPQLDKTYAALSDKQRLDTLSKLNDWNFDIQPYDRIANQDDLSGERFQFVRILENAKGKKTALRIYDDMQVHPSESQITAAMMRLAEDLPTVGFVTGQGERQSMGEDGRGYKRFSKLKTYRFSLINNGFEFKDVSLDGPVSDSIGILVIAEPRQGFSDNQIKNLNNYIGHGGNLLIAGDPGRQEILNRITVPLGVRFLPGQLVDGAKDKEVNLVNNTMLPEALSLSDFFNVVKIRQLVLPLNSASPLQLESNQVFKVTTLFHTSHTVWNELQTTNFVDQKATLDATSGEKMDSYPTVVALSRNVNNKNQKIIITADADWLSNGEFGIDRMDTFPANLPLVQGAFFWLSGGKAPISAEPISSKDNWLNITKDQWNVSSMVLKLIFPGLLILTCLGIWLRRRSR